MDALTIIAIAIFLVLMLGMSFTAGTQASISQLAYQWKWLLLVSLWSQVLLLPKMLDITPQNWQWLPFLGIGGVIFCGHASITEKVSELVHIIAAAVAFTALTGWVMSMNSHYLLPLVVCAMCGRERLVWRVEVGLVISVYLTLLVC